MAGMGGQHGRAAGIPRRKTMITESKGVDILLVEDSPHDAELAIAALKARNLGDKVLHLIGGEQVLDFICANTWSIQQQAEHAPKLILLDLQLGGLGGLEVLQQLKVRERTRPIPVVIFSGANSPTEIWASYRLGANGYVVKPTDTRQYAQMVGDIAYYWLVINRSYY
jgi:CheY-like chemotaxis protein